MEDWCNPSDDILEPAVVIDIDAIGDEAKTTASRIVRQVTELYADRGWMDSHPVEVNRIRVETETLRGLLKMRSADEQVHDSLIQAINANGQNPALYRSLAEIQRTSLAITEKINSTLASLEEFLAKCKSGDVSSTKEDQEASSQDSYFGSKSFITDMRAAMASS